MNTLINVAIRKQDEEREYGCYWICTLQKIRHKQLAEKKNGGQKWLASDELFYYKILVW